MISKGHTDQVWKEAKQQTVKFVTKNAREGEGRNTTYGELAQHLTAIQVGERDEILTPLLDDVCGDYLEVSSCLVTALVVHKDDGRPGPGFFKLAKRKGFDVSDEDVFWLDQRAKALVFFRSANAARLLGV